MISLAIATFATVMLFLMGLDSMLSRYLPVIQPQRRQFYVFLAWQVAAAASFTITVCLIVRMLD